MKQIKYNSFLTLHFRARNATQGFERVQVLVFVGLFVLGVRLAALQVLVRVRVPQRLRLERRVLGLEILFILEYGTLPRPPVGTIGHVFFNLQSLTVHGHERLTISPVYKLQ